MQLPKAQAVAVIKSQQNRKALEWEVKGQITWDHKPCRVTTVRGSVCGAHRCKIGQARLAKGRPQESNVWALSVGCYSEGSGVPQEDFKRGMTWSELYLWKLSGSTVKLEERGQLGDCWQKSKWVKRAWTKGGAVEIGLWASKGFCHLLNPHENNVFHL